MAMVGTTKVTGSDVRRAIGIYPRLRLDRVGMISSLGKFPVARRSRHCGQCRGPRATGGRMALLLLRQLVGIGVEFVEAALDVGAGAGHQFLEDDAPAVAEIGPARILPEVDRGDLAGFGQRLAEIGAVD